MAGSHGWQSWLAALQIGNAAGECLEFRIVCFGDVAAG